MVDDQIDGDQRVDAHRVAAGPGDRRAHGGEVDDRRDAGEVLEQDAGGHEGALAVGDGAGPVPARDRLDVAIADRGCRRVADAVLEQDLERDRQPRDVTDASLGERGETVIGNPRQQFGPGAVGISASHDRPIFAPETVDLTTTAGVPGLSFSP